MSRRGVARRAIEWFWRGSAMAALRASGRLPSAQARELNRRARVAVELGGLALEPPHPFQNPPVDALACQLFAQAITWALLAQRVVREGGTDEAALAAPSAEPGTVEDLAALFAEADEVALARAAGSREAADTLAREIAGKSFVGYAALSHADQARLARSLLPFAQGLCDEVDSVRGAVERLWVGRVVRLGMLAATLGAAVWLVTFIADKREQARDLARGRPWVASSRFPEHGCISPEQECANSDIYFFATNEETSPQIEWDLGSPQKVSGVRVNNRTDCCSERAVPLVVEISVDHKNWNEVAHRNEDFGSWKAQFPAVQARWVRFRVPRRSLLHFTGVRILR